MEHKPIYLDGVDVSGCISFDKNNEYNICCYDDIREDKIPFANFCVENKDCYFKQLARKTQECEELKRKVELMMDCPDCKVDEYKKALEEIEEIIKTPCAEDCVYYELSRCYDCIKTSILDIIHKAKGGRMEIT